MSRNLRLFPGSIFTDMIIWDFRSGDVRYELHTDYGIVVAEVGDIWRQRVLRDIVKKQIDVDMLEVPREDFLHFVGNLFTYSRRCSAPTWGMIGWAEDPRMGA